MVNFTKQGYQLSLWVFTLLIVAGIKHQTFAQAPSVTLPTVTAISSTGATLGGTVTGTLTHRGTRWSTTSPVGTSNELEEASVTAGAFTQARTGLPAASRIFFVAYARNGVDVGTTGETTFYTEPAQLTGGDLSVNATGETTILLTFPAADSWEGTAVTGGYVIFRNAGSAPSLGALADGAAPPADGVGDKIATITDGTATSFNNTTGLSAETEYYYTIVPFVWDGSTASTYNYNLTSPQTASDFTFSTNPTNHPSNGAFTVTAVSSTQINLAFDAPSGNTDGYIILRRNDASDPTIAGIIDGVNPATLAGLLPAGTTLAGTSTSSSFNDMGLSAATRYRYLIIPYNANASSDPGTFNYKTDGTPVTPKNDWTFATQPSGHATGSLTATPVSSSQINLSFNSITTSGISNAAGYILLIKNSAIVVGDLAGLADGAAPNSFGLFKAIINSTAANSYNDATGLSPNTTYHYALIPFNRISDDETYNFLTTVGFVTGSATTLPISASFTEVPGGTAPVISGLVLSAGTNLQVITGFSVTSEGTQEINSIGFNYSGLSSQFNNEYLYRSTTAGTLGSSLITDGSPDGNFDLTSLAVGDRTINSTPVYYYLVVDVDNAVTSATASVTVAPTQANITVNTGIVNAFSISKVFTFNTSQNSNIILNGGTTASIDYIIHRQTDVTNARPSLATFRIQDGSGAADGDNKGTTLTDLTIGLTNHTMVRRVALYDGVSEVGGTDQLVSGPTVSFTGLSLTANDGNTKDFTVRATFQNTVTDKAQIHVNITSATAAGTGSGFAAPNAGGATTSGSTNVIEVNVSALVLSGNPPSEAINTNFPLTIQAQDAQNNVDIDYAGCVNLTRSGGAGTLTAQPGETLNPTLVNGVYNWTTLRLSQSGNYTLTASDDDPCPDQFSDPSVNITITSSNSTITPGTTTPSPFCYGSSFFNLSNIVITETDVGGITGSPGSYSFSIALPSGFVFDQTVTSGVSSSGAGDITIPAPPHYSYPAANIVEFSFNLTGTTVINALTLSGLKVRHPHPGTASPPPTGTLNITRLGGTAIIAGVAANAVLGSVAASQQNPAVNFGVVALSGNPYVEPTTTTFNVSSVPVNLSPTSALAESVFTGSGVTFSSPDYRFNPSSLSPGSYPITLTHTAASGCQSYITRTFDVIVSGIVGLNSVYCNNDPPSPNLGVNQAYIDLIMGGPGWQLSHFVYYKTAGGTFNWVPITLPNAYPNPVQFDPAQSIYNAEYLYWGGQIPIGFAVCNGGSFPCNGTSTYVVTYQWVTVRSAPTVSFSMQNTFCVDDAPITLIGNPPNSDNILDDRFNEDSPNAPISVSPGNPRVWTFSPSTMGVGSANVTYTYKDPATGCSSTSPPINVTVNSRPSTVPGGDITTGTLQTICQGTTYSNFIAATIPGTSYTWYSNSGLTDVVGSTNIFTPPVDNTIAQVNTFYVTRTILGCESNKQPVTPPPALSVSVNVIATPGQPAPNRNLSYCVAVPIPPGDLQVTTATGTVKWYRSGNPAVVFTGTNPTATDLGINNMIAGFHVFELTQTEALNGCEGPIPGSRPIFTIEIKPLPSLTLTADVADLNTICTTGGTFKVTAFDQGVQTTGGLWSGTGLTGALSPTPFGEVIVNPVNLNPDNYTLQYDYTAGTSGCSNNTNINFKILPRINVTFNPLDSCDKAFVRLNNQSTVNYGALPTLPATTVTETAWLFQDGSSLAFGNGAVPAGTNGGRTQGTYFNPEHKFSTVGGFTVQTTMRTSDGCVYTGSRQLNIKPKPVINFSWRNPCRIDGTASTDTTRTFFQATETSIPAISLAAYDWNFKVNNVLDYFSAGTGANPEVRYNVDGVDNVRLIATSVDGCMDTIQKPVYVVPRVAPINLANTYLQTFTTDDDRWLTGGQNSSWQYGTPAGSVINTPGEKAWVTNLTGPSNTAEQSWVLSRCFDFTSATKPAIALDIWADTPAGIDGAVLQVNTSGNIESDANWMVVGAVGQGVNWYDQGGIASKPGNQPAGDVGWSGSALDGRYLTWKSARFKLDNLIGNPRAIFRIAYASTVSAREGFAFDNVFIGERSRSVLVENFTNTSATANTNAHNDAFRLFEKNSVDIVKLQYHTGFPGTDPVNALNPLMHNARTTFYGIGAAPTFRIDGEFDAGAPLTWITPLFNDRTLEPAQLKIESSQIKIGADVKINTYIKNNSTTSAFPAGSHVFTVVVEKLITDNAYRGAPNDTLLFVAKQMLPSPAGVVIPTDIAPGDSLILSEITWDTRNLIDDTRGSIIIFVQSIQGGNKEVHQSKVFLSPPVPDLITAIEDPAFAEKIDVYPNPASHELNILLPEPARSATPFVLIDAHGRNLVEQQFSVGQQMKTINTSQLAAGLYILQIKSQQGTARKKVMIVHGR